MMPERSTSEPWYSERVQAARAAAAAMPRNRLAVWSGWGFVLSAAIAVAYGLWTLYGSGSQVTSLDLATAGTRTVLGPISLDPGMNPLRAVLRAAYVPVGSTRIRYEIEIADGNGARLLEKQGSLGNKDDDASIVRTTESLGGFRLSRPGEYFVRAQLADNGMDDLRGATLELRRNVTPVDSRIPWGFGLAAVACLIVNLGSTRRRGWPYRVGAASAPEPEKSKRYAQHETGRGTEQL